MKLCQRFMHIDTGIILINDVNTTDHCLVLGGMMGCQVSKSVVAN